MYVLKVADIIAKCFFERFCGVFADILVRILLCYGVYCGFTKMQMLIM